MVEQDVLVQIGIIPDSEDHVQDRVQCFYSGQTV